MSNLFSLGNLFSQSNSSFSGQYTLSSSKSEFTNRLFEEVNRCLKSSREASAFEHVFGTAFILFGCQLPYEMMRNIAKGGDTVDEAFQNESRRLVSVLGPIMKSLDTFQIPRSIDFNDTGLFTKELEARTNAMEKQWRTHLTTLERSAGLAGGIDFLNQAGVMGFFQSVYITTNRILKKGALQAVARGDLSIEDLFPENRIVLHHRHRHMEIPSLADLGKTVLMKTLKGIASQESEATIDSIAPLWDMSFPGYRFQEAQKKQVAELTLKHQAEEAALLSALSESMAAISAAKEEHRAALRAARMAELLELQRARPEAERAARQYAQSVRLQAAQLRELELSQPIMVEGGKDLDELEGRFKITINTLLHQSSSRSSVVSRIQDTYIDRWESLHEDSDVIDKDLELFLQAKHTFGLEDVATIVEAIAPEKYLIHQEKKLLVRAQLLCDGLILSEARRLRPLLNGRDKAHQGFATALFGAENLRRISGICVPILAGLPAEKTIKSCHAPGTVQVFVSQTKNDEIVRALEDISMGLLVVGVTRDVDALKECASNIRDLSNGKPLSLNERVVRISQIELLRIHAVHTLQRFAGRNGLK